MNPNAGPSPCNRKFVTVPVDINDSKEHPRVFFFDRNASQSDLRFHDSTERSSLVESVGNINTPPGDRERKREYLQ